MIPRTLLIATAALSIGVLFAADPPKTLAPPVALVAAKGPINVDIGHAAPFVGDMDGDGIPDLLVGQFEHGKLRIYRNIGTGKEPKLKDFMWFEGTVPEG